MNILVLTSVYKDISLGSDDRSTNVVNSFVRDWVEQGHKVEVIHNSHQYPKFIHKLPFFVKSKLAAKMGFFIADYKVICKKKYEDYGAKIWRLPMLKIIPHRPHSHRVIVNQVKQINSILEQENFSPDVIVGHWASPQMEIISLLKDTINCRTALVLHGLDYINQKGFQAEYLLKKIDRLGCRSKTQAELIKNMLHLETPPFVCYSGVPDDYIKKFKLNTSKFENVVKWKFAYVGRLVEYKQVDVTIRALNNLSFEWELDVVGEGAEKESLKKLCINLGCANRVRFHGQIPRNQVMEMLRNSHCFIMVSKGEIFGLVYLEAMAASCVTIGSLGEGIDGIIVDGINGYLCEPADAKSLEKKIKTMMREPNLLKLVQNGYDTACNYADSIVARNYLRNILE